MTIRSYSFDGGTIGATVATNSPLAAGDTAWSGVQVPPGGSFQFSSDKLTGAAAGKITLATGDNGYGRFAVPSHTSGAACITYKTSALTTAGDCFFMRAHGASALVWGTSHVASNFFRIRHTSSDNAYTTSLQPALNTFYTVDVAYNIAGASSNIQMKVYDATGATVSDSGVVAYNFGSTGVDMMYFGPYGNTPSPMVVTIDNVKHNDAAAVLFGPPGETVVNYTGTVTITGWTAVGGTAQAVLSDSDVATKLTSIDNPTNATCIIDGNIAAISPQPAGNLYVRVNGRALNATSATYTAKLYVGGVEKASTTAAIPSSFQDVDVTFPAASLTGITPANWAAGVQMKLMAAAS